MKEFKSEPFVNKELKKAVRIYGSQGKLAKAIGQKSGEVVSQQLISYWLKNPKGVPSARAKTIVALCPTLSLLHLVSPPTTPDNRQ